MSHLTDAWIFWLVIAGIAACLAFMTITLITLIWRSPIDEQYDD